MSGNMRYRMSGGSFWLALVSGVLPGETATTVVPAGSLVASSAAHQATNVVAEAYWWFAWYRTGPGRPRPGPQRLHGARRLVASSPRRLVASSEFAGSLPGWDGFAVEYSAAFRELLRSLVVRAGAAGEPDPAVADQRAEVLVMAIFGIQTMVRAGAGQASSHASFAALHAMVDAWR